ncbi:MAG: M28 family metallopeptidase [Pseudomonadota bacterium]
MRTAPILLSALLLAAGPISIRAATAQTGPDSAANIKANMAFLAGDTLKGREAGSPGYEAAADYVARQMKALGLKPMGANGSYFQTVPLVAARAKNEGKFSLKDASGKETPLVFGTDYLSGGDEVFPKIRMNAPLVFVGYGLVAPEKGRDDYAGLDVKGKIVVALSGAPKFLQTEERAYYRGGRAKLQAAKDRGAIGYLSVGTLTGEKLYPFANRVRQFKSWGMSWRQKDGTAFSQVRLPIVAGISVAGAQKLFGAKTKEILAQAETEQGAIKGFDLNMSLSAATDSETRTLESRNIVGLLPGSDPRLKNEYIVLSAHLDHLGITPPVKGDKTGDTINNGALDNAAGVSTTLEVARLLSGKPPRRSMIFLVNTAEEKGLIGSEYFARNPPVPVSQIVADVNLDMPILTYDFSDVVAFGADRSTIGPAVKRAAERMKVKLSPDPMPDEGVFTRSDHYRFVEQGIPAVFLMTGFANGGEKAFLHFMKTNYHKPSDDLKQPINYDAGAKFAKLNAEIARELGDAAAPPQWNKGDFFAARFRRK